MSGSPFKKGIPWLTASLLLFLTSVSFYLYDFMDTDQEIIDQIEASLQSDFENCIRYYSQDSIPSNSGKGLPKCDVCQLEYGSNRKLISWTNDEFLPNQKALDRLNNVPEDALLTFDNRHFYQVRQYKETGTTIYLIPIYISYEVDNEFLIPYVFLSRWKKYLNSRHLKRLWVLVGNPPEDVQADVYLYDLDDKPVLSISRLSPAPFRAEWRMAVLILGMLGTIGLFVFLRVYALHRWRHRYIINSGLFLGILLLRLLLFWVEFPGKYIEADFFGPDILAFHLLAPSIGDLTLNILTLTALAWIAYTHLFRLSNIFYRKVLRNDYVSLPIMVGFLILSSLLIKWFVDVFRMIMDNSQVDIEFSNVFKTDIYSFLILLDVGLLLLAITLGILIMIKLNVLYGRRHNWPIPFILIQGGILLIFNLFLHDSASFLGLMVAVAIVMMGFVVYRIPFKSILHHDLANYLIIVLTFSVLITYNIIIGINFKNQQKAQRIADRILGSRAANTVSSYMKSIRGMERDIREVRDRFESVSQNPEEENKDFRKWLVQEYIAPNFKEFEVRLFMYDSAEVRLDPERNLNPIFGPETGIPLEDRGERVSPDVSLYQFPNSDNQYNDPYMGKFELFLHEDSLELITFQIELQPNNQEFEGLYPSLSLDQRVYNNLQLINSFDHAIYRDGLLYNERGKSSFPIYMEDYEDIQGKTNRIRGEYHEYLEPIGTSKIVVVRYSKQKFFDIITTFSFIFYFFSLASILLIGLPVLGFRTLRARGFAYEMPLKSKIRVGLLAISVLPMLVILLLLYPFVASRYDQDAKHELREETSRLSNLISPDYRTLRNDPFSRITLQREFSLNLIDVGDYIRNDVNIYDEFGKYVASTQPLIFELGIQSDLMDARAFEKMTKERSSGLVMTEQIGNLSYISGYQPILGNNDQPIGFINVPYIARQDQLEEQVINFLAYLANIYLLAFLLLNVIAVVVSNAITQPLTIIQQRLAETTLGDTNEPIVYNSKDEIGEIVATYNQMVDKLVEIQEKIKQNERELAWRQMARQVAHEIKNPLTPMKLSIQHLSRAWNEKTPRLEKMFPKVMKTLMVQIDSMVRIANSFSEFAKMPEPDKAKIKVNDVLLEVIDLYTQSEEAIWLIDIPQEEFWAFGDRDQLSRSFNNIIKNALQAIEDNGIIHVSMRILEERARIEIKDNGKGMPVDIQKKVFEPSFSTKTSGMGLGLAIVKRIIENTGGTITFKSQEGEGTTFVIEIPSIGLQDPFIS